MAGYGTQPYGTSPYGVGTSEWEIEARVVSGPTVTLTRVTYTNQMQFVAPTTGSAYDSVTEYRARNITDPAVPGPWSNWVSVSVPVSVRTVTTSTLTHTTQFSISKARTTSHFSRLSTRYLNVLTTSSSLTTTKPQIRTHQSSLTIQGFGGYKTFLTAKILNSLLQHSSRLTITKIDSTLTHTSNFSTHPQRFIRQHDSFLSVKKEATLTHSSQLSLVLRPTLTHGSFLSIFFLPDLDVEIQPLEEKWQFESLTR